MSRTKNIVTLAAAVVGICAFGVSDSHSGVRKTETAGVQPCESECSVNYWMGNNTYYCYPGGEWECPLYKKEDDGLGRAR